MLLKYCKMSNTEPFVNFSVDSLTIYDGGSSTSPMVGNPYCGETLPPSQISSSNQLFIHFHSDTYYTGTGFKLEFNATSKNSNKMDNSKIIFVSTLTIKKLLLLTYCPVDFYLYGYYFLY